MDDETAALLNEKHFRNHEKIKVKFLPCVTYIVTFLQANTAS